MIIPELITVSTISHENIKREGVLINRILKIKENTIKETQNVPKNTKNIEEINQLISEALVIIRKNSPGVYASVLENQLNISEYEFKELLPRLERIEDIIKEKKTVNGIPRTILRSSQNQKSESSETKQKPKIDRSQKPKQDNQIKDITYKMVAEHIHWKTNINKKLKIELIDSYLKHKSMQKVFDEFPGYTKQKIRLHLMTNIRLPPKLKEIESSGGLHSNPTCSIVIALYAADHYNWDNNGEEAQIIELAKSISKYLQTDQNLNNSFEGRKK